MKVRPLPDGGLLKAFFVFNSPIMRTVAIIAAGPAGLTAAYEVAKRGYKVEIFDIGSIHRH